MSAPENYMALLDMKSEDAIPAPVRPGGTYRITVKSNKETQSSQKQTPGIEFTFTDWEPMSSVNKTAWDEYVASPVIDPVTDSMTYSFWLTAKAMFMLKEFCVACGVDPAGKTIAQMVADAMGERVLVEVQQSIGQRSGRAFAEIKGFALDE